MATNRTNTLNAVSIERATPFFRQTNEGSSMDLRASSPPTRVRAIALNTFRESVRDRVLYNLILFALVLMGASIFVSDLSIDQESTFIADLGLSSMIVFGGLIAIFIGVGLVYKEIDKKTIYSLLSKPVHRYELIVGKYAGLCMTLLLNCAVMALGTIMALAYVNRGFTRLELAVLPAAFLIYLEHALLVAVALTFSTFTTPMLSALFSFATYVIGHFSGDLQTAASLSKSGLVRVLLTVFYYLLPNLSNFGFIGEASRGQMVPVNMALSASIYAGVYCVILVSIATFIFQWRNFK
jgi:ABC-type transport system involved in multi-copper enzyme maturation permease subunit